MANKERRQKARACKIQFCGNQHNSKEPGPVDDQVSTTGDGEIAAPSSASCRKLNELSFSGPNDLEWAAGSSDDSHSDYDGSDVEFSSSDREDL